MHESVVFSSTCTMSSYRNFTFAISSPDEFLVTVSTLPLLITWYVLCSQEHNDWWLMVVVVVMTVDENDDVMTVRLICHSRHSLKWWWRYGVVVIVVVVAMVVLVDHGGGGLVVITMSMLSWRTVLVSVTQWSSHGTKVLNKKLRYHEEHSASVVLNWCTRFNASTGGDPLRISG